MKGLNVICLQARLQLGYQQLVDVPIVQVSMYMVQGYLYR